MLLLLWNFLSLIELFVLWILAGLLLKIELVVWLLKLEGLWGLNVLIHKFFPELFLIPGLVLLLSAVQLMAKMVTEWIVDVRRRGNRLITNPRLNTKFWCSCSWFFFYALLALVPLYLFLCLGGAGDGEDDELVDWPGKTWQIWKVLVFSFFFFLNSFSSLSRS